LRLSPALANITGQAVAPITGASSLLRRLFVNVVRQATRLIGVEVVSP
jgi:hypothetical protein